MGEFWDTHDFTEFDTDAPDVEFQISCMVPIDPDLLTAVEAQAQARGLNVETHYGKNRTLTTRDNGSPIRDPLQ
jgi:hypothetical protein